MTNSTEDSTITLISGANQGIGRAAAISLAKEHGHHVIVGSRSLEAGAKVADSLVAKGYAASSVQLDLVSDASIAAAAKYIEEKFGRLDVLINNAGILLDATPGVENTRNLFTKTFTTNVIGTACLTEAMLPLLRKSSLPRIIFVSSRMGSITESLNKNTPYYQMDCKAYDASKAAVNMLTGNYARSLADCGGHVNSVCPGLIETNLHPATKGGHSPEYGAQPIVELASMDKDGPNETFSDREGVVPW